jgi:hypothetical protein
MRRYAAAERASGWMTESKQTFPANLIHHQWLMKLSPQSRLAPSALVSSHSQT